MILGVYNWWKWKGEGVALIFLLLNVFLELNYYFLITCTLLWGSIELLKVYMEHIQWYKTYRQRYKTGGKNQNHETPTARPRSSDSAPFNVLEGNKYSYYYTKSSLVSFVLFDKRHNNKWCKLTWKTYISQSIRNQIVLLFISWTHIFLGGSQLQQFFMTINVLSCLVCDQFDVSDFITVIIFQVEVLVVIENLLKYWTLYGAYMNQIGKKKWNQQTIL